jgi:hypothetical protein
LRFLTDRRQRVMVCSRPCKPLAKKACSALESWRQSLLFGPRLRNARADQIRELEKMTQEFVTVARKLPHGRDREIVLQEIREFRAQISALKAMVPKK